MMRRGGQDDEERTGRGEEEGWMKRKGHDEEERRAG